MKLHKVYQISIKTHLALLLLIFMPISTLTQGLKRIEYGVMTISILVLITYISFLILSTLSAKIVLNTQYIINSSPLKFRALLCIYILFVLHQMYLISIYGLEALPLFATIDISSTVKLDLPNNIFFLYCNQLILGGTAGYLFSSNAKISSSYSHRILSCAPFFLMYCLMGYAEYGGRRSVIGLFILYIVLNQTSLRRFINKKNIKTIPIVIACVICFWVGYQKYRAVYGSLLLSNQSYSLDYAPDTLDNLGLRSTPMDGLYNVIKDKFDYGTNTFPKVIYESVRFSLPFIKGPKIHPDVILVQNYPSLYEYANALRIDIPSSVMLDFTSDLGFIIGPLAASLTYIFGLLLAFTLFKYPLFNNGPFRINLYGVIFSYILSVETGLTNLISIWIVFFLSCLISQFLKSTYTIIHKLLLNRLTF